MIGQATGGGIEQGVAIGALLVEGVELDHVALRQAVMIRYIVPVAARRIVSVGHHGDVVLAGIIPGSLPVVGFAISPVGVAERLSCFGAVRPDERAFACGVGSAGVGDVATAGQDDIVDGRIFGRTGD